ncbi:MAG: hypothetical protein Q8M94_15930 [Ignavibacteria bacterium]|nr:hypothetical protein [Ignavibacteria bacterium]
MKTKIYFLLLLVTILINIIVVQVKAQEDNVNDITLESLKNILIDSLKIENTFSELFNNPETIVTLNKIWKENVIPESRFLKDLHLEIKTFKVSNSDSITGLGVGYSFAKDITRRRFESESQTGISLSLRSQGNIAFEKKNKSFNVQILSAKSIVNLRILSDLYYYSLSVFKNNSFFLLAISYTFLIVLN